MQIHLFGSISVTTDSGTAVDVGPGKCRTVLAALALSVGQPVPVPRLIDLVWDEHAPPSAAKTLQGYIARLRRALGHDAITRQGPAYVLQVDPDSVDVARFIKNLRDGAIPAALDEWTAQPLAGASGGGLRPVVDGLVEQWLGAVRSDLERRVDADPPAVVADLTRLTAQYPFSEGLWALLMIALYRSDRQADALAVYRRARRHLNAELGIEPGPHLKQVQQMILAGEVPARTPQAAPDDETRPHAEPRPIPGLPRGASTLWGREPELEAVGAAMAAVPVVTLVGPGGIGKTALALAAARRESAEVDRARIIELAEVGANGDVARAAADALAIAERSGRSVTDAVITALRVRPTLVILDNCEHVIDGTAALATAIADFAPGTKIIVTSRELLNISGERVIRLSGLDPTGAGADLFAERAHDVSAGIDPVGDRDHIVDICRRLDGIPLAIELAAARSASLTPAQLADRLDDRLKLLTAGRRDGAPRHRTMRAAIEWSHDLMTPDQRRLFGRLSVFPGPFDLAAAEAVVADTSRDGPLPGAGRLEKMDVDRLIGDLVDHSMIATESEPAPSEPAGRRFRLLETVRHFAAEQLSADGDANRYARRHANWCLHECHDIGVLLSGPREADGVARLESLWLHLRAAVDLACQSRDVRLVDSLLRPIAPEVNLRRRVEIGDWAERLLNLSDADDVPLDEDTAAYWLMWAAQRYAQADDGESYERLIAEHGRTDHPAIRYAHAYLYDDGEAGYAGCVAAAAWLRERGEGRAADLVDVAGVGAYSMTLGRFGELDELAADMEQRFRDRGPPTLHYFALGLLGYSAEFQGRHDDAVRYFRRSAATDVPAGAYLASRPLEVKALFEYGEHDRAVTMLREHVEELLGTDFVDVARMVAIPFVAITARLARYDDAARILGFVDELGGFAEQLRATLLADAVTLIEAHREATAAEYPSLDGRKALAFMSEVLGDLAAGK